MFSECLPNKKKELLLIFFLQSIYIFTYQAHELISQMKTQTSYKAVSEIQSTLLSHWESFSSKIQLVKASAMHRIWRGQRRLIYHALNIDRIYDL